MQMHPLPLLLCSLLFNHENNLPLSLSLFFSPLSIAIEKPRAPLLSFLSKKRMDSRTCSFMEYSQERECFALIKNRMELVSIIDLESTSAPLSVIIQTSIIISSWTFYRAIYYGRSPRQSFARSVSLRRFYNPGYVKNVARSFKVPSQSGHWWSSRRKRRWFTKRSEKFQSQSNMKFLISRDLEVWFEEYFYSSLSQESLRNEPPRLSSSRYTIRPFLGDCSRMKGWRI